MTAWRLDRSDPLNAVPEFYDSEEDAKTGLWRLEMSGYKFRAIVWEDVARYEGGAA